MSLLETYSHAINPEYTRVIRFAKEITPVIEQIPIPGPTAQFGAIEERRDQTVEGLRLLSDITQKPTLVRSEVFKGVKVTTLYFDKDRKRIQLQESADGKVAVSLMATRVPRQTVAGNPISITEDIAATTFVFARNDPKHCIGVNVNPNVQFGTPSEREQEGQSETEAYVRRINVVLGIEQEVQPSSNEAHTSQPALDQGNKDVVAALRADFTINAEMAPDFDKEHLLTIRDIQNIIFLNKFNAEASSIWNLPKTIELALLSALDEIRRDPQAAEIFAQKPNVFGHDMSGQKQTIYRMPHHTMVIDENTRNKQATLQIFGPGYQQGNPTKEDAAVALEFDLAKGNGKIIETSYVVSITSPVPGSMQ